MGEKERERMREKEEHRDRERIGWNPIHLASFRQHEIRRDDCYKFDNTEFGRQQPLPSH